MADRTKIEWCDATVQVAYGCSPVSEGCDNCYARTMTNRFYKSLPIACKWDGSIIECPQNMEKVLRWRKHRKIFIGSMTDVFHENAGQSLCDRIFEYISKAPQHIFMILTKRPEIMEKRIINLYNRWEPEDEEMGLPLFNLWLGVSVCNQQEANEKIPILLRTQATQRFISVEPMLGSIDLTSLRDAFFRSISIKCDWDLNVLKGEATSEDESRRIYPLDWVICGGETGRSARPMQSEWVEALRSQCNEFLVPFFFKSWGSYPKNKTGVDAGNLINGKEYKEFPMEAKLWK